MLPQFVSSAETIKHSTPVWTEEAKLVLVLVLIHPWKAVWLHLSLFVLPRLHPAGVLLLIT